MFVVILTYLAPLEQIDQLLAQHAAFLDRFYEQGRFICSGRRIPRTGGVILVRADHESEVEQITKEDPFYRAGLAAYEIIQFVPTKYGPGLAPCFS